MYIMPWNMLAMVCSTANASCLLWITVFITKRGSSSLRLTELPPKEPLDVAESPAFILNVFVLSTAVQMCDLLFRLLAATPLPVLAPVISTPSPTLRPWLL